MSSFEVMMSCIVVVGILAIGQISADGESDNGLDNCFRLGNITTFTIQ